MLEGVTAGSTVRTCGTGPAVGPSVCALFARTCAVIGQQQGECARVRRSYSCEYDNVALEEESVSSAADDAPPITVRAAAPNP